jgi:lysozyme family protein
MANIEKSMELLMSLEHSNIKNALHKNKTETGYTYKGIYQTAWPDWIGWNYVLYAISVKDTLEEASEYLERYEILQELVNDFYKEKFWDLARLDEVTSQKMADEIFIFGVNTGMSTSVKRAQKLVGCVADGSVGHTTIKYLNSYDESKFDIEFDELEKEYYALLIEKKPYLKVYKNGWNKRADAV